MHTQYEQVFTRITQGIYDDAYQQFGDQPDIEHYTGTLFLTSNPQTATRITSETGCCMPWFLFGKLVSTYMYYGSDAFSPSSC